MLTPWMAARIGSV